MPYPRAYEENFPAPTVMGRRFSCVLHSVRVLGFEVCLIKSLVPSKTELTLCHQAGSG